MHVIKSHPVAFSPPVQNNTCLQDTDNNPSLGTMKPTWPRISDYKSFSLTDAEDSPKMSTKDSQLERSLNQFTTRGILFTFHGLVGRCKLNFYSGQTKRRVAGALQFGQFMERCKSR